MKSTGLRCLQDGGVAPQRVAVGALLDVVHWEGGAELVTRVRVVSQRTKTTEVVPVRGHALKPPKAKVVVLPVVLPVGMVLGSPKVPR